jgi:hypothetical protein
MHVAIRQPGKARPSFCEQKEAKKLFAQRSGQIRPHTPNGQRFFGSFFQKRTPSLDVLS